MSVKKLHESIISMNSGAHSRSIAGNSVAQSIWILTLFGTAHCIVDACCAATAYAIVSAHAVASEDFFALLLFYHALAFGLQSPIGLIVDAIGRPRLASIIGCMISASSLFLMAQPSFAIAVAGVGNALFHVGGGIICLRISPHRATAPGIFVAPGSLGLFLGVIFGKHGSTASLPLIFIAAALCF
jgi:FSR family fosmidomycin resistance protein-like MFS transporter